MIFLLNLSNRSDKIVAIKNSCYFNKVRSLSTKTKPKKKTKKKSNFKINPEKKN